MVSTTSLYTIDKRYNPKLERYNPNDLLTVHEPMTQHQERKVGINDSTIRSMSIRINPLIHITSLGIWGLSGRRFCLAKVRVSCPTGVCSR